MAFPLWKMNPNGNPNTQHPTGCANPNSHVNKPTLSIGYGYSIDMETAGLTKLIITVKNRLLEENAAVVRILEIGGGNSRVLARPNLKPP